VLIRGQKNRHEFHEFHKKNRCYLDVIGLKYNSSQSLRPPCSTRASNCLLVLKYFLSLQYHVFRGFSNNLARTLDGDVFAFDRDRSVLLH